MARRSQLYDRLRAAGKAQQDRAIIKAKALMKMEGIKHSKIIYAYSNPLAM